MTLMITDDCNACEIEYPNNAIYTSDVTWDCNCEGHEVLNLDHTYIATEKWSEWVGFYDEPQCIPACPSDAIVPDPDHQNTHEELLTKKEHLYLIGR